MLIKYTKVKVMNYEKIASDVQFHTKEGNKIQSLKVVICHVTVHTSKAQW